MLVTIQDNMLVTIQNNMLATIQDNMLVTIQDYMLVTIQDNMLVTNQDNMLPMSIALHHESYRTELMSTVPSQLRPKLLISSVCNNYWSDVSR